MKMRGRLKDIMQDVRNGGFDISFHVQAVPSGVETLREDTDLAITLAKWREQKRSLSANAYYWVIVGKISEITKMPNAAVHNLLLRRYGVPETIDGELVTTFIPDTDEASKDVLEKEIYHLKPTSYTKQGKNGTFRAYVLMKGSSDFDTKEMTRLIDGAIDEAKDLGIDTVSTEEVKRMMEDYEKHYGHR